MKVDITKLKFMPKEELITHLFLIEGELADEMYLAPGARTKELSECKKAIESELNKRER